MQPDGNGQYVNHWLRLYHDTTSDPKWGVVSEDSGQPIYAVVAVWAHILEFASASPDRGTLSGWSDRVCAASLELTEDAVTTIRTAMQGLVLDGDRLIAWSRRQPKREDRSALRMRRLRSKTANAASNGNAGVTHSDADV